MKSSSPGSAHCRSSNTITTGAVSANRSKKRRQAENRSSLSGAVRSASPIRCARRGSRNSRSLPAGDPCLERFSELRSRNLRRLILQDARPGPHHLAQRPVRDSVAVGQAPATMPQHVVGQSVDVLLKLPGEPRLANTGHSHDRHESSTALVGRGVEQLFHEVEISLTTNERRFQPNASALPSASGDHPIGSKHLDRLRPPFDGVCAGVHVRDCGLR